MVLLDALFRRADSKEQKVTARIQTVLPPHLFVRILDMEFDKILSKVDRKYYDPGPLRHLNRLLKDETIDDPEWKLSWTGKQPLLFKNGKRYIPNDLNL